MRRAQLCIPLPGILASAGVCLAMISPLTLAGCSSSATNPSNGPTTTASQAPLPQLLTWTDTASDSASADVLLDGALAVNDAGCITLGPAILVAPPGSTVLSDGSGITIINQGEVQFGHSPTNLAGGFADITGAPGEPSGLAECQSSSKPETQYVIVRGA